MAQGVDLEHTKGMAAASARAPRSCFRPPGTMRRPRTGDSLCFEPRRSRGGFRGIRIAGAALFALAAMSGCAAVGTPHRSIPQVTLPALKGWYAGERIYYITTEISDQTMAAEGGATFAPRLKDAILAYGKPGVTRSVLERVYKFPDGGQDAVFASAPRPPGPSSADEAYSPLWLAYFVRWEHPEKRRVLTSEEAILAASDAGDVRVERTDIVINCPILQTAAGALPHALVTP